MLLLYVSVPTLLMNYFPMILNQINFFKKKLIFTSQEIVLVVFEKNKKSKNVELLSALKPSVILTFDF